jgi:hypothetical protein
MAPGVPHPKGKHSPRGEVYGQPWPLSEDFYLAVFDSQQKNYGLYLVDSFGNKELLYRDPKIACLDPIPFRPRKRPPVIPIRTQQAKADQDENFDPAMGVVTIMNIYESEYPWPEGTKIKELRVINFFPKPNETMDGPYIGPAQSLARGVLGTVPVEEDGSVHFECPTSVPIYFQALDEKGMMVQNMRSITYLHPGETLTCIGCHEKKSATPKNTGSKTPMALKRPPSKLKKESEGSYPLTFPRLVQPVLDKHCARCHNKTKKRSMRSDEFVAAKGGSKRSLAYSTLMKHAWGKKGGNGALSANGRSYSIPGQEGARVSKLYERLMKGHSKVKLSPEEMHRITLWMDCNSNYFGAYLETEKQHKAEIVKPLLGVPPYLDFATLKR